MNNTNTDPRDYDENGEKYTFADVREDEIHELQKEVEDLKEENEKLKQNVFNADTRCRQFRTKVGYDFIHESLTNYCRVDVDSYDGDLCGQEEDYSYIVDEKSKDYLFEECAKIISDTIDTYIRLPHNIQDINLALCEEVQNVVDEFETHDLIKKLKEE
jgi:hypothetical protein